eukprot:13482705-Alexandrium_andersonii.AAC.1
MRGPRHGLNIDLRGSRGVHSAPFFSQTPNLPTRRAGGRTRGTSRGGPGGGAHTGRLHDLSLIHI